LFLDKDATPLLELWFTVFRFFYIIMPMSFFHRLRWSLTGILDKLVLWLWAKSTRMKVIGKEAYKELRNQRKAVIFFVWFSNNC